MGEGQREGGGGRARQAELPFGAAPPAAGEGLAAQRSERDPELPSAPELELLGLPPTERTGFMRGGAAVSPLEPAARTPRPQASSVRVGSGALAVQADLLAVLRADLDELRGPPLDLSLPLRVVVPSASLREHVAGALLRHVGAGVVGVRIQTLAGLAREMLDRADELVLPVEGLLGVIAARAARAEPVLASALGGLRGGFELVAEAVADLLDAGLGPEHADALDELLAELPPDAAPERARAVLRAALAASEELARLGRPREGDLLARAAALLDERGAAALPARAVRVHGFADATGRAADLLLALLRALPTAIWLDAPPDPWPADPTAPAPIDAYVSRLRERLTAAARTELLPIAPHPGLSDASADPASERATHAPAPMSAPAGTSAHAAAPEVSPPDAAAASGARSNPQAPEGEEYAAVLALPSAPTAAHAAVPEVPPPDAVAASEARSEAQASEGGWATAARGPGPVGHEARSEAQASEGGWATAARGPGPVGHGPVGLRRAPGPEDEVRAIARDIRERLDAGAVPERIAVIARDLEPWVVPIRTQFARLGIPFSGIGRRGPPAACGRQLASLLELLREPAAVPVARWLDLLRPGGAVARLDRSARADLALAAHVLGAGRIGELAALDLEAELAGERSLRLPVRLGIEPQAGDAEERGARLRHRRVGRSALLWLQGRAQQWMDWSERARGAPRAAADHARALLEGVEGALGWSSAEEPWQALQPALSSLASALPDALALEWLEFASLLARALEPSLREPIGGAGAGVAVLDVMEARARCFDQLFLLGLTRDAFPRALREDPLLPDAVRTRLAWLLPDLPIRARGRDEERHLFAQLLSASPRVVLSYAERARGGELELPSSFVERFQLAHPPLVAEDLPALGSPGAELGPRTAHEHAVLGALHGGVDALSGRLALALAESAPAGQRAVLPVERARIAVLRELEELDAPLGPYFGFIGPLVSKRDPRRAPLFVTALEGVARCPWQAFVRGVLRIEPPVDALADLPGLEPQRIGTIVHGAFEAIAARLGAPVHAQLAELLAKAAVPLRWPPPAELRAILEQAAQDSLREEGIRLPGLARALAESLLPRLAAAPALLAAVDEAGDWDLLGAEVQGSLPPPAPGLPGSAAAGSLAGALTRPLSFRADWVLASRTDPDAARLRLLDFKTGRCFTTSLQSRAAQRIAAVASGRYLQALLYGLAGGPQAEGAYVFLDPELEPALAYGALPPRDAELRGAFERTASLLGAAHAEGLFVPRLQQPGSEAEPSACRFCEVSQACLQGDLAARSRFARALQLPAAGPPDPLEQLLRELLELPEPPG